ncbi:MAG: Pex protein, partial [Cyanobacteriota bacterium]|nr:Pex protein [Cyanobacteriota bacterium]
MFSRRKPSRNSLADIQQYFRQPPPQFLDLELAVCWVLECLLKDDNYPSGLLQKLTREEPQLRLSETVLQQALEFLEEQGSITT